MNERTISIILPTPLTGDAMNPARSLAALCLAGSLLAGCAPAMRLDPAPDVQRPFVGSWQGTGEQSDHPGEWSIAATIAGGAVGAVVGTIAYPSLQCGGELILRRAAADSMELREHITHGDCVDGGIITLGVRPGGWLAYGWRAEDGTLTARGQLAPARSPAPNP